MGENKFLNIKNRMLTLDARNHKLDERLLATSKSLDEHNSRFEKLRKGYVALGLVTDMTNLISEPIIESLYIEKLLSISLRFENSISGMTDTTNSRFLVIDESEKYISDLLTLTSDRWSTIIEFMKLWKSDRIKLREQGLKLIDEYNALENQKVHLEHSEWIVIEEGIFEKVLKSIELQENKITLEEEQEIKLEDIFQVRESLYSAAVELFQQ